METLKHYQQHGYIESPQLLTKQECKMLLAQLLRDQSNPQNLWNKSSATQVQSFVTVARSDRVLNQIKPLLGSHIILWGASLIERPAQAIHHWHSDLEIQEQQGGINVWIGLKNTSSSAFKIIPDSHHYGCRPQTVYTENQSDKDTLQIAQKHASTASIKTLVSQDGDALIFNSQLWHSTKNHAQFKTRYALLLQYANSEVPIRIPKFSYPSPSRVYNIHPLPPCLVVSGSSHTTANKIVNGSARVTSMATFRNTSLIDQIITHNHSMPSEGFLPYPLLNGSSPDIHHMESHYSALAPQCSPHEPHSHDSEEILIVIKGEATLTVATTIDAKAYKDITAVAGDFIYYPKGWQHTISNKSDTTITYLMFKWQNNTPLGICSDKALFIPAMAATNQPQSAPSDTFNTKPLLGQETQYLRSLHCHRTLIAPTGFYDEHVDAYDLAIILLKGSIVTMGETVTAPAIIYHAAGEPHGLANHSSDIAEYLVFEFHGKHSDIYQKRNNVFASKLQKILRDPRSIPRFIKRKTRQFFHSKTH